MLNFQAQFTKDETYTPKINKKSKEIKRDSKVEEVLLADSQRRLEKKNQNHNIRNK